MASENARSKDFRSPDARLSFAQNLFAARAVDPKDPNSKKKFGCTLIFPKAALQAATISYDGRMVSLEQIVGEVIQEMWPKDGIEFAKRGMIRSPFLDGNGKEARNSKTGELHPGMGDGLFFIRTQAGETNKPAVSSSNTEWIPGSQKEVYSGCTGFGLINAFAWDDPRNGRGVSFGISAFYKIADGERLGGDGGPPDPTKYLDRKPDNAGNAPDATRTGGGAGSLFGANAG